MFIDILVIIVVVFAVIKGYQRGLIVGIFSFIAVIIGLAAAIKLSAVTAGYIGKAMKISDAWLPVISFAIVFILVVLLIRLGANLIQKAVEVSTFGWANRLGGILLYSVTYLLVFSILLFYAAQVKLLQQSAIENSVAYSYLQPWGPKVIEGFGAVVPIFRDMFAELQSFFGGVAESVQPNH